MNREPYAIALNSAMTEIMTAYPDIKHSFIFTKTGNIITGNQETDQNSMNNVLEAFDDLKETAKVIGDLKDFHITGKNGKITLSKIKDVYLVLAASKSADKSHVYAITHVIIPTILKTFETIDSTNLQSTSFQKKLIVDTLTGFFAGDSVQIDIETLKDWNKNTDPRARVKAAITNETMQESIDQVQIITFDGNAAVCKVKEIDDQDVKGKNVIRIPEKLCKNLEINKGDLVKVEPVV